MSKLDKIIIWLEKLKYLPKTISQQEVQSMLLSQESRIKLLEFLLVQYNEELFQQIQHKNDFTDLDVRTDIVKHLIL